MTLVPAPHVAWLHEGDVVHVAQLPSGPAVDLRGPAAHLWLLIVEDKDAPSEEPDGQTVVERVVAAFPDAPDDAVHLVTEVLSDLLTRGWVRQG